MLDKFRPYLELNLSLILMSTSGILGRVIDLPVSLIIFFRCVVGAIFLFFFIKIAKEKLQVRLKRHRFIILLAGSLLSFHWVTYFFSIKISSVAVGMISLFTYPVITTLIEPLFFKTKLSIIDLISSVAVIFGIFMIVPAFDLSNDITYGILIGVFSALLYSVRNLLNKKLIHNYSSSVLMLYQLLISAILLIPTLFIYDFQLDTVTIQLLLLLSIITTATAHTLFVKSLKYFSTSTASILSSLIPVYGILWAVLFISEKLSTEIIIGGSIIVLTVAAQSLKHYGQQKSG
ncbi:DMT family transporter [Fulvivirgaceae bacterium BMA10]|uniref:DMT family transporter n=1 Tax=Splendidivirga corallicola TaxID=3051826 RepID=A0ABT8KUD6_9BACT|nr:DMT family transporter [Fulvivirgaceae bacterium BMA10]